MHCQSFQAFQNIFSSSFPYLNKSPYMSSTKYAHHQYFSFNSKVCKVCVNYVRICMKTTKKSGILHFWALKRQGMQGTKLAGDSPLYKPYSKNGFRIDILFCYAFKLGSLFALIIRPEDNKVFCRPHVMSLPCHLPAGQHSRGAWFHPAPTLQSTNCDQTRQ